MLDQSFQQIVPNEFRVIPGSFSALRKQIFQRMLIPGLLILALMIWMFSGADPSLWMILLIIPVILGFSMYTAIKRQEKQFYSYRLIINSESVQREQEGMASIMIPRGEITKILKADSGAYSIIGGSKLNAIVVYAQIERSEALEEQLSALAPIQKKKNSVWQKLSGLLLLLIPAVLYSIFVLDNIWLSGLALLLFTAGMLWSLIVIYTSRNLEKRLKNFGWIVLLPLLSAISGWLSRWELW